MWHDGDWIAVFWISKNPEPVYCGMRLSLAADALVPCTCYAVGPDRQSALDAGLAEQARFLKLKEKPTC